VKRLDEAKQKWVPKDQKGTQKPGRDMLIRSYCTDSKRVRPILVSIFNFLSIME